MAKFTITTDRLLKIVQHGLYVLNKKITDKKLYHLTSVIEKWKLGFTEKYTDYQYNWEGEITLESFENKIDELPWELKNEYWLSEFSGNETNRKHLNQLKKWERIALVSTSDIEFTDDEFIHIVYISEYTLN